MNKKIVKPPGLVAPQNVSTCRRQHGAAQVEDYERNMIGKTNKQTHIEQLLLGLDEMQIVAICCVKLLTSESQLRLVQSREYGARP